MVEVVVASAILGITVAVALGTIDASIGGGRQAVHQAWAQCMVRETAGAIIGASWADSYGSPNAHVRVTVAAQGFGAGSLQTVTVTAEDPDSRSLLYTASFLKAKALQGDQTVDMALPRLASACPKP